MSELTNKQALYCLTEFRNGCDKCQFRDIRDSDCRIWEARDIAIDALRKQVLSTKGEKI